MQYPPTTPITASTHPRRRRRRAAQRPVVFRDQSAGLRYLTVSDRPTDFSTTWPDGNIYPVVEVDLSSAAHHAREHAAAHA